MLFAVCAPGLEPVLLEEMRALGLPGRALAGGIEVDGDAPEAMRLNLHSRTASRVLLRMGEPFRASAFPELVRKASELPWERFVRRGARASFRVTCRKSRLYHSDAVAERLHAALEAAVKFPVQRVPASEEVPGEAQLFVARLDHDVCTVSADSSGPLLHQRGWRGPQAKAPLRETLAAALLLAAGFRGDEPLCDPLCGAGTIAIEAALIATARAPGIARAFAFQRWKDHSARQWEHLTTDARKREKPLAVRIEASDQDAGAIAAARDNASRAGVEIEIAQRRVTDLPADAGAGLLACNPPYGVRTEGARAVHDLEEALHKRPRWRVAMIAPRALASAAHGLRLEPILRTQNGGIPVEVVVSRPS